MADMDIRTSMVVTSSSLGVLSPAFKMAQQIAVTYNDIKFGHQRCKVIIQQVALIVKEAHGGLQKGQISVPSVLELHKRLEEVQTILKKLASMSFFKALFRFGDVNILIKTANRYLIDCFQLFQIDISLYAQAQTKAIRSDQDALMTLLKNITGNYGEVCRCLGLDNNEQEVQAMAVMGRELRNITSTSGEDMPVELRIMKESLQCIKTVAGRSMPKQCMWLITEYDLDYCGTIGSGGFSTVSKAQFRGTMVAVKTLNSIRNMREALETEIEIWRNLRHDHIVPFYGASTLTSAPYIVSRYMRNGNLVQYLSATPNADRTRLMYEVSLGMYYLHEESVIHGDLKSLNVLVDDSGKACITDFGLSKVYSLGSARIRTGKISGTPSFLAPEALRGQPLSFKTDVYAFGITTYEVFTGEVPSSTEGYAELRRPTEHGFNDALWQLLSDCVSREPSLRPRFNTIQKRLSSTTKAEPSIQLVRSGETPVGINFILFIFLEPTLRPGGKCLTDWGLDTKARTSSSYTSIHTKGKSVSTEQPSKSPRTSMSRDIKTFQPMCPKLGTCDELTDWGINTDIVSTSVPSALNIAVAMPLKDQKLMSVEQPGASSGTSIARNNKPLPPIDFTVGTGDECLTDLRLDPEPEIASIPHTVSSNITSPLSKGKSVLVEQPSILSRTSIPRDLKALSPMLPMCIEVTHKYFSVRFDVLSREPGVRLEEIDNFVWQPIKAKKKSLLCEEGNKFWCMSSVSKEKNSWELNGNNVIIRTPSINPGVCRFEDPQIAEKWFRLQLSYARDGSTDSWVTARGDWFHTERRWRRFVHGKLQYADLVKGDQNVMPTDNSWSDANLPRRHIIDNHPGIENRIVCITNPGRHQGKFCCRLEGHRIVLETYRLQSDQRPMKTKEEVYVSEEQAEMMFDVLQAVLRKREWKKSKLFSF